MVYGSIFKSMTKTEGSSSITISKLAFLDEMLDEPILENSSEWGEFPSDEIKSGNFINLIKTLAAKILTEEELLNVLGDERKPNMWGGKVKYKSS